MHLFRVFSEDVQKNLQESGIKTRPDAGSGLWVAFLVPATIVASSMRFETDVRLALYLIILTVFHAVGFFKGPQGRSTATGGLIALACFLASRDLGLSLCSAVSSALFKNIFVSVLTRFPESFTVGEALCVTQTIGAFLYSTILNAVTYYSRTPTSDGDIITFILQIGFVFVGSTVFLLYASKTMSVRKFCAIVIGDISAMFLTLHLFLGASPELWLLSFIFSDRNKIIMIAYWALMSILSVLAVNLQTNKDAKASTSQRKVFHFLAVAVYIPGIFLQCDLTYLASGIALAALVALETIRKLNLGWFSSVLNDGFRVFSDEKDYGGLSLTPIYLLLGIAGPLFYHPLTCDCKKHTMLALFSGILSVGIGDSVASYYGSNFGKRKWPGTSKSIDGTIANFFSQLAVFYLFLTFGLVEVNYPFYVYLAILVNCTLEAFTDQIDNLVLPFVTYMILIYS